MLIKEFIDSQKPKTKILDNCLELVLLTFVMIMGKYSLFFLLQPPIFRNNFVLVNLFVHLCKIK
jgi:hypothetical protein